MYNKSPFASWVPKPVMLLLIFIIMMPALSISGVYTSIATDTAGAMAIYNENITLAYYAGSIGMALAILIFMRVKGRFRVKEIICGSAIILAILSYMCGTTEDPAVLITCSFLIGFFKTFLMFEMILPIMFIITPTGDRGKFYSFFYPLSIGFGQFSSYWFADLVYNGSWERPYIVMSIIMLLIAVLSIIFQHNQRFSFKTPLYQIDWLSMVLLASSFMCLSYFLVFMKQQGWFISPYISGSLIASIVLFALLIWRQKFLKRKMIFFAIFKRKNVIHGTILLLFMGLYLGSSTMFSQYTLGVLGYNNLIVADTSLWMIPGVVASGFLAFLGFKKKWPIKYFIMSGFISLFLYNLILYLTIQPQMDVHYLEYSMVLKGLGMGILYIGIWFYLSLGLELDQMFGVYAVLIPVRTALATAIGSAIIGWALYQGQWQSLNDLATSIDASQYPDGMAIYQNVSYNALMSSSKIVLGSLCWLIVPILIFIMTHSYGNFNYRRVILLRKMVKGNSIKGYKLS